jgi:hypothetical protein
MASLPTWPYLFAALCPFMPLTFAFLTQTRHARALCAQVGFAQPPPSYKPKGPSTQTNDHDELNPLLHLLAAKEAMLAFILLGLQVVGEWKALALALGIICVGGVLDVVVSVKRGSFGWGEAVGRIGLVKMVGALAAWRIWWEN